MRPQNFTPIVVSQLQAELEEKRAERAADLERAKEMAAQLPPAGDPDPEVILWNKAGNVAAHACAWAAFVIPILLVLEFWD